MSTPATKPAPKPKPPRALDDHVHMHLVADTLSRALDLLDQHDVEHQRDALTQVGRKASRTFLTQCRRAAPEPADDES